ncbi:MAG: FAD/NAD(P)-binding protein [Solirubrobacteraceae bacterium]
MAIVGAGASGMLTAAHLLRAASARATAVRAVLIDRNAGSGGVAYSTNNPDHRLNVTAARMSAFPDRSTDFVSWRAHESGDRDPGAYAARSEFRQYLDDVVATARRAAAPDVELARVTANVAGIDLQARGLRLRLQDGVTLDADAAVLALGNQAPLPPTGADELLGHAAYVNDPWAQGALERLAPGGGLVVLIGTGLTMVDVAIELASRHPRAQLLAVSRSGLLPRAHSAGRIEPQVGDHAGDPDESFAELVDAILAQSAAGSRHWHQLVDELRPRTQTLWRRLSTEERADFLDTRHRAWCVHRHRMPPQVAAALAQLIGDGSLKVRSGSVELTPAGPRAVEASVSGAARRQAAIAINCTGPSLDPRTNGDRLVQQLLADGLVRAHPVGVGFDTAEDGAFRSRDGVRSVRLFTLGPPRIGELYETTAIPEIREQAQALADTIVSRLTATTARAA